MAHFRSYRTPVKIGNWKEDLHLEEVRLRNLTCRGELISQRVDFLKRNILTPVNLSGQNDGRLHFGDVVMLVNVGGEDRECSAISISADIHTVTTTPSPGIQAPCAVSAGKVEASTRTALIITSVDGSPEGSTLHYDQGFALKTTSGFARGLYLTSDLQSFQKCARMSRLQEVNLDVDCSVQSCWKIVYFDPQERLEYEGQPVPANVKVLIVHCMTNKALAVLGDYVFWTTYGKEYEVTAHTFLDSHKAEADKNHWIVCTSDPSGGNLKLLTYFECHKSNSNNRIKDNNV
uniref:Cilia and flagella associated protein 161 n=1 Tax=Mola mola TaxID=94237 RepID=A0A3Q3WEP0_MOLML